MSLPDPPLNIPRIFQVLEPQSGQYIVTIKVDSRIAQRFPDKPFGTSIEDIGLSKKDSDKYPGYVLTEILPIRNGPYNVAVEHYWSFQKLGGPQWTTTTKSRDGLLPNKWAAKATQTKIRQEVALDAVPDPLTGNLVSSIVEQKDNTGKALRTNTVEELTAGSLPASTILGNGQVGTISETLITTGGADDVLPVSALIPEGSVENLGNGKSIKKTITVAEVFDEKVLSKTKPNVIPPKFLAQSEQLETVEVLAATVANPTLAIDELERSEQRVSTTKIKRSTKKKPVVSFPQSLIQTSTGNDGILARVTETLQTGNTVVTPTAYLSVESEALGDGTYLVKTRQAAEILPETRKSIERPDLVPTKFKGLLPTSTTSAVTLDPVTTPALATGDLSKSIEQVSKFKSRTTTTNRSAITLPATLVDTKLTNQGQLSTVTQTLNTEASIGTIVGNHLTLDASIEKLGDGNAVKTVVTVPELFTEKLYSTERPEVLPAKFRISNPSVTTQQVFQGDAVAPELLAGDLSRNEQQLTVFTKKSSVTSRALVTLPKSFTQTSTTNDGVGVTVTETVQTGNTTEVPTALISVESEALGDGTYLVKKSQLAEVLPETKKSNERPDVIPVKFKALLPTSTVSAVVASTAAIAVPTLTAGELSKTSEQVTKYKQRTTTSARSVVALPALIVDTKLTNLGQVSTVTQTLDTEANIGSVTGSALTLDASIEKLGDGNAVKTVTTVPTVFDSATFSAEKPDVLPVKFRAKLPAITSQKTIEGVAFTPALATGELSKSEQQVTAYTKRTSNTVRSAVTLPASIVETKLTNQGQVSTVTQTLDTELAIGTVAGSAFIIDASVEKLGDGTAIKTVTTVPEVFDNSTFSTEKPEVLPVKFRAAIPSKTTQITTSGAAADANTALGSNDLSKSEQQVTAYTKRTSTTSRALASLPKSFTQTSTANDGTVITVTETVQTGNTSVVPTALVSIESEALGDGTYLVKKSELAAILPETRNSIERPDLTPAKFKGLLPTSTVSSVGTTAVVVPTLATGELSKSSEQVSAFKTRTTTSSRTAPAFPAELIDTKLTAQGQVSTITQTLNTAASIGSISGSALIIDSSIEKLGDGNAVKTVVTVPTVFDSATFSVETPEVLPVKFRAATPAITSQRTIEGVAFTPTLGTGDLSKSEQQVTAFTKKVSATSRATVAAKSLTGSKNFVEGAQSTVTERYDPTGTQLTETGLNVIQSEVTALGDGSTLRETITAKRRKVDGTLEDGWPTKQKKAKGAESLTPAKFQKLVNTQVVKTQETLLQADVDNIPTPALTGNQTSVQHEKVNDYRYEKTVTTETIDSGAVALAGKEYGQIVDFITEENLVADGTSADTGILVVASQVSPLGNGKSIKTTKKVATWPAEVESELSKEIPDLIPPRFKKSVSRTKKTSKVAAIPATVDLSAANNEIGKTYKKETAERAELTTITEVIDANAGSLVTHKIINEFGGLIATTTESLVSDNTVTLVGAFGTLDAQVTQLGNGKSVSSVTKAPVISNLPSFPSLSGTQIDPRYGVALAVSKQIVEASTSGGLTANATTGVITATEIEPLNQWHAWKNSVSIASLPQDQIWYGRRKENFPDILTGITVAGTEQWYSTPAWRVVPDGTLKAKFTRKFSYGNPNYQSSIIGYYPSANATPKTAINYIRPEVFQAFVEYSATTRGTSRSNGTSGNNGTSSNQSTGTSLSTNTGTNTSQSNSQSSGTGSNISTTNSTGTSRGTSSGTSSGNSDSRNRSENSSTTRSTSTTKGDSVSKNISSHTGTSRGTNTGESSSKGQSISNGSNSSSSSTQSTTTNNGTNTSSGSSSKVGISADNMTTASGGGAPLVGDAEVNRSSTASSKETNTSTSTSTGVSQGVGSSTNSGTHTSSQSSSSTSISSGTSSSQSTGDSNSETTSSTTGESLNQGTGITSSEGTSTSGTSGTSNSTSVNASSSEGVNRSVTQNDGTSVNTSNGTSSSTNTGTSSSTSKSSSQSSSAYDNYSSTVSTGLSVFQLNIPKCLRAQLTIALPNGSTLTIPATTPASLPSNDYLEVSRNSEHWRNGIWVTEIVEVYIPE